MDEKDLPKITKQMKKFIDHLYKYGNKSEAYRFAYNTENMMRETVWSEASKLSKDPKVTPWLQWIEQNQTEVIKEEIKYEKRQAMSEADEFILMALENKDADGNEGKPNLPIVYRFFELKNRLAGNLNDKLTLETGDKFNLFASRVGAKAQMLDKQTQSKESNDKS